MAKKEKNYSIDEMDRRILQRLQEDASAPVAEIAADVGLSATPCWRRIRRLRELGIIRSTIALLDKDKLGLNFYAFVFVNFGLPNLENTERFERKIREWPEVVSCHRITGALDYVLQVVTEDMQAYDDFLRNKLMALELISDVQSRIVLSPVKDSHALPLGA